MGNEVGSKLKMSKTLVCVSSFTKLNEFVKTAEVYLKGRKTIKQKLDVKKCVCVFFFRFFFFCIVFVCVYLYFKELEFFSSKGKVDIRLRFVKKYKTNRIVWITYRQRNWHRLMVKSLMFCCLAFDDAVAPVSVWMLHLPTMIDFGTLRDFDLLTLRYSHKGNILRNLINHWINKTVSKWANQENSAKLMNQTKKGKHSLDNRCMHILCNQRIFGFHIKFSGADCTVTSHFHVEKSLRIAASAVIIGPKTKIAATTTKRMKKKKTRKYEHKKCQRNDWVCPTQVRRRRNSQTEGGKCFLFFRLI